MKKIANKFHQGAILKGKASKLEKLFHNNFLAIFANKASKLRSLKK